jgi:hypothetical protein
VIVTAAVLAAHAWTDRTRPPSERLRVVMDCYGHVAAAHGPGRGPSFPTFRRLLSKPLAAMLPKGCPAEDLEDARLIDDDGALNPDLDDLLSEHLIRIGDLELAGNWAWVRAEQEERGVFRRLQASGDADRYTAGRRFLIAHPAGPEVELRRGLDPSLQDAYLPLPPSRLLDQWWFPCPLCGWPMEVRASQRRTRVACSYAEHRRAGASYTCRAAADRAPRLVSQHSRQLPVRPGRANRIKALRRPVWRYVTIPGLLELALAETLREVGAQVALWPNLDEYDLHITLTQTPTTQALASQATTREWTVDVKDWRSAHQLAAALRAEPPNAQWIVIPDHKAADLALLRRVLRPAGVHVATASGLRHAVHEAMRGRRR